MGNKEYCPDIATRIVRRLTIWCQKESLNKSYYETHYERVDAHRTILRLEGNEAANKDWNTGQIRFMAVLFGPALLFLGLVIGGTELWRFLNG